MSTPAEPPLKDSLLQPDDNSLALPASPTQFQLTPLQHLLDKVGGQHRYQFCTFMIFNAMWFLTSWMLVGQGFFFDNRFQCQSIEDEQQCINYVCGLEPGARLAAMSWHANSFVFEFENELLICNNDYIRPILTSLLYVGSLLGFFVIPYVADNWGRKIGIRLSWTLFLFGIVINALADSPNMVGLGQLLTGFGCNPAITLCYSFLNQQVLRSKRQYYGVFIQVALAIGQVTIAFMFIPQYSYKVVLYILLGMVALTLLAMNYLVQSPKFLIAKSKQQTLEVLNHIARINKRQHVTEEQIQSIAVVDNENSEGASLADLFKYKSLLWPTIGGGIVFLAIQVIYYGTLLNLDHIGYSKMTNQLIIGLSEMFGYIGIELIISRVFRKKWSLLGMGGSSALCFILAILTAFQTQNNVNIMKVVQVIGLIANRFVLCGFWGLFYVYIGQLYPTKVRSIGFGWASAMGTIGSTIAPYMIFYSDKAHINSWIPPGVVGVLGFVFLFTLKETFGKALYDDIEEVRIKGKYQLSDEDDGGQEGTNGRLDQ